MSRVFGWGSMPSDHMMKYLYKVAIHIVHAKEEEFDIWEILMETDDDGNIEVPIENGMEEHKDQKFSKYMCNYLSFGVDARIGMRYERKRTRKRCCNKCCVFWEGVKRLSNCCFDTTWTVRDSLDTMCEIPIEDYEHLFEEKNNFTNIISRTNRTNQAKHDFSTKDAVTMKNEQELNEQIIFSTSKKNNAKYYLSGNPVSLVASNIPSYMGGRGDLWLNGKTRPGLVNKEGVKIDPESLKDEKSYKDGILEFTTFYSIPHMPFGRS